MTSKAGFQASVPAGATGRPARLETSSAARNSTSIAAPVAVSRGPRSRPARPRQTERRAAGRARPGRRCRPCWRRCRPPRSGRRRSGRGRPGRWPCSAAAALSASSVCGRPALAASHAVSRAPCNSGLVSSIHSRARRPARCAARITANAVPSPADTRLPVLQWVRIRASAGTSCQPVRGHRRTGPCVLARRSRVPAPGCRRRAGLVAGNGTLPGSRAATRAVSGLRPRPGSTAVGRAAEIAAAAAGTSSPRAAASATP